MIIIALRVQTIHNLLRLCILIEYKSAKARSTQIHWQSKTISGMLSFFASLACRWLRGRCSNFGPGKWEIGSKTCEEDRPQAVDLGRDTLSLDVGSQCRRPARTFRV